MQVTYTVDKTGCDYRIDRLRCVAAGIINVLYHLTRTTNIDSLIMLVAELEDRISHSNNFYIYWDRKDHFYCAKQEIWPKYDDMEIHVIYQRSAFYEVTAEC